MSCLRPNRIDLYLEGELAGPERAEVERHLAVCPACRLELEDRRLLVRAVAELAPVEVPEGFAEAVMARLPKAPGRRFGRVLAPAAVAGAVLTALSGYYLATGQGLVDFLGDLWKVLAGFAGLVVPVAAKVLMVLRALVELVKALGTALLHGLGILAPLLRPEVISIAALLGFGLFVLVFLGFKKIASLGERP
ncbi:MAG TPA: zf-HC2 domain-containing protein [Burkholderiales bacterium]|nr:zf-HC2 domain-containing protein [Burkholderiales bacterium]